MIQENDCRVFENQYIYMQTCDQFHYFLFCSSVRNGVIVAHDAKGRSIILPVDQILTIRSLNLGEVERFKRIEKGIDGKTRREENGF